MVDCASAGCRMVLLRHRRVPCHSVTLRLRKCSCASAGCRMGIERCSCVPAGCSVTVWRRLRRVPHGGRECIEMLSPRRAQCGQKQCGFNIHLLENVRRKSQSSGSVMQGCLAFLFLVRIRCFCFGFPRVACLLNLMSTGSGCVCSHLVSNILRVPLRHRRVLRHCDLT